MNLVRNQLQRMMTTCLLNSKLLGHFNLPSNIFTDKHNHHHEMLAWIWRNVIKGHDVAKPNSWKQEPQFHRKLPHPTKKCYAKLKRKQLRKDALDNMYTTTKLNKNIIKPRTLKRPG
eukprot:410588_1